MSFVSRVGQAVEMDLEIIKPLKTRQGSVYQVRSDDQMMLLKAIDLHDMKKGNITRLRSLTKESELSQKIPDFTGHSYISSGELDNYFWILRKWLDGETAWSYTEYIRVNPWSKANRIRFIQTLCRMLEKVMEFHKLGYLHGDLQPSHFIIDRSGVYHLIDLETAISINNPDLTYRGALVHYVSPEVAKGMIAKLEHIPLDIISEIYSFGAVAFFLYSGVTPVAYGQDMTDQSFDYSFEDMLSAVTRNQVRSFDQAGTEPFPQLEKILMKCLTKNRNQRYQTFESLYDDLNNVQS